MSADNLNEEILRLAREAGADIPAGRDLAGLAEALAAEDAIPEELRAALAEILACIQAGATPGQNR